MRNYDINDVSKRENVASIRGQFKPLFPNLCSVRCLALQTLDTCERDAALKALEAERAARRRAEMEAAEARLRCEMLAADCSTLREALSSRQQHGETAQPRLGYVGEGEGSRG